MSDLDRITYANNRKKYRRPQALLFSDEPGDLLSDPGIGYSVYVPRGVEFEDYIILSDHNRDEIQISPERIENRKRMINGRMRSYWLADKFKISVSWKMLPSRSATSSLPATVVDPGTGIEQTSELYNGIRINKTDGTLTRKLVDGDPTEEGVRWQYEAQNPYVVDTGSGGADLLRWYENHTGSFYVWLAYDRPEYDDDPFNVDHFKHYAEIRECFFSDFQYSIVKRSGIYDFWDVSLELEEV